MDPERLLDPMSPSAAAANTLWKREEMREEMNDQPAAFDDRELRDWLIELIADGPENFLCALAEAVVTADANDYRVIRPALIELKRKYYAERSCTAAGKG
jgi:hypothetical protein